MSITFKRINKQIDTKPLYEIIQETSAEFEGTSVAEVRTYILSQLQNMVESIEKASSTSELSVSGMSGLDSAKIKKRYNSSNQKHLFNPMLGRALEYSIAILEENQRMGRIVACPTAGSCGIVPAVIISISEEFGIDTEKQIDALITAGGIGQLVAREVQLAGAVAGCQAECGVASAMAAGAAVCLMGGSNNQIFYAASLALKNLLGLVCDPIAGLVEVPCVKRNGFLAIHAITAAECALAGVESVVSFGEVIEAMKQIGENMSPAFKETSEGGLAVSKTAQDINEKLSSIWNR